MKAKLILFALAVMLICIPLVIKEENYQVVVILKNKTLTEYWKEVKHGIEKSNESHKVNIVYLAADSESDVEGQLKLIDEAILNRPDAIILASNDYTALDEKADLIKKNRIKLVVIDSGISYDDYDSYVATDNYVGGYKAGHELASRVDRKSNIIIMNYSKGSKTAIDREMGVIKAISDSHKDLSLVIHYCYDDPDAAYRMTEMIVQSDDVAGIVSLNETSSLGVAKAINDLSLKDKVILVAYDSSIEEIKYLEEDVIDALVVQKPFNIGYLGLETTIKILQGKRVEKIIDTGSKLILKDNMYNKENMDLLFPFTE